MSRELFTLEEAKAKFGQRIELRHDLRNNNTQQVMQAGTIGHVRFYESEGDGYTLKVEWSLPPEAPLGATIALEGQSINYPSSKPLSDTFSRDEYVHHLRELESIQW